jgi:hypothetical protein
MDTARPFLEPDLLVRFIRELSEATSMNLVNVEVELPYAAGNKRYRLDFQVRMTFPIGGHVDLAVEVLTTGYPRDVRLVSERLQAYKATRPSGSEPVELCVVADYLSPGSRQELWEAGINYFDGTGSMRFKHRTTLIVKERGPRVREERRPVKLFSGAREQVVHALFEHWRTADRGAYISGTKLATSARTSTYTVSQTMQELERENWVESTGSGPAQRRRLSNPAGMLDAWAAAWTSRRERVTRWYGYSQQTDLTDRVLLHFAELPEQLGWALTGAAAANAVLSHLTSVDRVQVIVPPGQAEALGKQLKLKQVDKGANVVFIEREGASLMFLDGHPLRPGSRFASRFVQYLDLLDGYGRNKDLASEYRRRALRIETEEAEDEDNE